MNRPLAAAALLVALAAAAAAHGAPAAREHETRLLHDHNDDCGGDAQGDNPNCQGTHDLIALDVREAHDPALGDVAVFRLLLNGGQAGAQLRDVLTLKAGGATKAFELRTSDNQRFDYTGFDRVAGPTPLGDGDRFAVEGTVKLSELGAPGSKVTDFRLEAYRGATKGDYVPGGYNGLLGDTPNPQQAPPTNTVAGCLKPGTQQLETAHCYRLRGPGYYAEVQSEAAATVAAGVSASFPVTVRTPFPRTAQTYTLSLEAGDGIEASLPKSTLDPAGGQSLPAELTLRGTETGATGVVVLTVDSSLGGRTVHEVPYTVGPPKAEATTGPAKDSPGAGLPIALGLLGLAAWRRRA